MEYIHGTVVCLKLKDFMQFSNLVEFRPGPMLNIVVGPNGSGKSRHVQFFDSQMKGAQNQFVNFI